MTKMALSASFKTMSYKLVKTRNAKPTTVARATHHFPLQEVDVFELIEGHGRPEIGQADVERANRVIHARK